MAGGCSSCGNLTIIQEYQQAFGVALCSKCRSYDATISKSNAKTMYLLSDSDLSKLGFIEKQNPQHKDWAPMKMYLVSQVESVAVRKYGSLAAVNDEKQCRVRDKIEERAKRRRHAEQQEEKEQQVQKQVAATLQKYTNNYNTQQQLQEEDIIDPETGKKQRRFAPNLAAADVEDF